MSAASGNSMDQNDNGFTKNNDGSAGHVLEDQQNQIENVNEQPNIIFPQ